MSILSKMIRITFARSDRKRDRGLESPAGVERFPDLTYADTDPQQVLDVYRPAGKTDLPVIVSVHGGAWVYGDKDLYQYYAMDLARRGFAVVNFSYRLAPEAKFPAQLEDVCLAFRWTAENIGRFGGDKDRLFAVGDSAGAHLLSLYFALKTDPAYAESFPFRAPEAGMPKAAALNCGAYRMSGSKGGTKGLLKDLMPKGSSREDVLLLEPLRRVGPGFPPVFLMTAVKDFLKDDADEMKRALDRAGVPNELHVYDDPAHELGHVFHLNMRSPYAARCNDEECAFFRRWDAAGETKS